jgi:hypothetical protein
LLKIAKCPLISDDCSECNITARQYGEVVLPDASIRAESWFFSRDAVTVQGGYGVVFALPVQILTEDWRESGYNNWQDPGIGTRFVKTVTSLLTLPSVLAADYFFIDLMNSPAVIIGILLSLKSA